jgi:hypothetical protein
MLDLYDCPECHRLHDEPSEPAYVLAVLCCECAFESRLFEHRPRLHQVAKAA